MGNEGNQGADLRLSLSLLSIISFLLSAVSFYPICEGGRTRSNMAGATRL